jgi:SAM-dependent methyltransferase
MPDQRAIYEGDAERYDALVSREDFQKNLLPALSVVCPLSGADVVEFGAGTGRVTRLVAPLARRVLAFDAAQAMLRVAASRLRAEGRGNVLLAAADNAALPVASGAAGVALAGWTFGHATVWSQPGWRGPVGRALAEARRVLRPGGVLAVIETLGTGREEPAAPSPALAEYYAALEAEHGLSRLVIRTDYRFASLEEAAALTRFFFGDALAARVERERRLELPECTGIWWRRF